MRNSVIIVAYVCMALGMCPLQRGYAASPPMIKTQAPGFYRFMLGNFEITALNDGVVAYPTAQVMLSATPEQIRKALADWGLSDPIGMSYNAFLINTGRKLVLIDTGTGGKLNDDPGFHGCGRLLTNLRASGYTPEQVDEVYITHIGPDHIGGLTQAGKRTFPNAILRASKKETAFFLDSSEVAAGIAASDNKAKTKARLQFYIDIFDPYVKAGKFDDFDNDIQLVPGIRALATPGHTPGHTSYVVESKGQTMVVIGDLVHVGALQFENPSLSTVFDANANAASAQRKRILQLAADEDDLVAGAHISFPGIGHVRVGARGYIWIPVNFTIPH